MYSNNKFFYFKDNNNITLVYRMYNDKKEPFDEGNVYYIEKNSKKGIGHGVGLGYYEYQGRNSKEFFFMKVIDKQFLDNKNTLSLKVNEVNNFSSRGKYSIYETNFEPLEKTTTNVVNTMHRIIEGCSIKSKNSDTTFVFYANGGVNII